MTKYLVIISLLISTLSFSQQQPQIIPMPQKVSLGNKNVLLSAKTVIQTNDIHSFEALFLQENIKAQTGLDLQITAKNTSNAIKLNLAKAKMGKEDYTLTIMGGGISVEAVSNQGLFYGIQSLLQLIPYQKTDKISLKEMTITDSPKYKWRGMHLDVCRHFFDIDFVKKYIDYIAMYKMNTFHWHLTEDQGWRIEIKKYPKLTEKGAWRNGSMVGRYSEQKFDTIRYGGFYTQDQIKEVVAYAQKRHITIIPEIELPGHALAALTAYPELSCSGGPFEVEKKWGVFNDVYCPKEETFTFLENVLSEIIDLFPSEYIHIGGDECPKVRWKNCVHCQRRIAENNLKDEHGLQSYFIQRIEKFVNSKGRKIIGWDEILEGGLAPNAAVMSWRGTEGGIAAAKQKHFVVMSPGSHCYFDHYQDKPETDYPIAFPGSFTSVEKVYSFNPMPSELSADEQKYILGAQANLWTEYILSPQHAEYMIMPRMAALSEVLWGTNTAEFPKFKERLIKHFKLYDSKGIKYSKAVLKPE